MLRTTAMPPDQAEQALASLERNAQLQARLIEDLLDVSRIVSGKLLLDIRRVDLQAVVEAALEGARGPAESAGLKLVLDVARVLPPVIGDAARLQQIAANLLSNAIKFSDRGGRVEVRLRHAGATVDLVVRDSGRGIRPELLPHVFDRFRQDESSTTRRVGGLGLGLAIVKHMVELHGGTVEAASGGEGQGATFTVRLPAGGGSAG